MSGHLPEKERAAELRDSVVTIARHAEAALNETIAHCIDVAAVAAPALEIEIQRASLAIATMQPKIDAALSEAARAAQGLGEIVQAMRASEASGQVPPEVSAPGDLKLGLAPFVLTMTVGRASADHLLGDLVEEYRRVMVPERGEAAARNWYRRQVIESLGPLVLARLRRAARAVLFAMTPERIRRLGQ